MKPSEWDRAEERALDMAVAIDEVAADGVITEEEEALLKSINRDLTLSIQLARLYQKQGLEVFRNGLEAVFESVHYHSQRNALARLCEDKRAS